MAPTKRIKKKVAVKKIRRTKSVRKIVTKKKSSSVSKKNLPRKKTKQSAPKIAPSISLKGLSLKETAAVISGQLEKHGHGPMLVGQACAAVYAGPRIKAHSLEFVVREYSVNTINELMASLGFVPKETHTFFSRVSPFEVMLLPAPMTVGDDVVDGSKIIKTALGPLRTLTPTDCVRHRLSMFYRWGDKQALFEAICVARRQCIDMDLVRRWSEWEWASDRFQEFTRQLSPEGF